MKDIQEKKDEHCSTGVKFGIVMLGICADKVKYSLLDERDIILARDYLFEARPKIDRNGNGVRVFAVAIYINTKGSRCKPDYVHNLIWERHMGPIGTGHRVIHKNGITTDNRLDNLCLVTVAEFDQMMLKSNQVINIEQSLYWAAIQQLPPAYLPEEHLQDTSVDANGNYVPDNDDKNIYYECHFPPCIRVEREPREFSICGRCQHTRYCGPTCQSRDWPFHKKYCREKYRRRNQYVITNSYTLRINERVLPDR